MTTPTNRQSPAFAGEAPRRRRFVRWLGQCGGLGIATLALLALAGAVWQEIATRRTEQNHPPPGALVDVGGHRLHYQRQGKGRPVVVMDAGLTGASYDWKRGASEIAKFTEVVTYDRAGYGWSDAGPLPRSSQQVVTEIRVMLQKAGIEPPYLLVGYSWGGVNMRLYASLYPNEVAGLVLADSVNYDTAKDNSPNGNVSLIQSTLAKLGCLGVGRLVMPAVLKMDRNDPDFQFRLDMISRTKNVNAIYHEVVGQTNWRSVRDAMTHLRDIPVTVISRQIAETDNGRGQQWWLRAQRALPSISNRGKFLMARSSSHGFINEEPEIVVNAIREMVEARRVADEALSR